MRFFKQPPNGQGQGATAEVGVAGLRRAFGQAASSPDVGQGARGQFFPQIIMWLRVKMVVCT